MEIDYAISVRPTKGGTLVHAGGQLVQQDRSSPVWGQSHTSSWLQGEVVRDDYLLQFGEAWPFDGVLVVPYWQEGGEFFNLEAAAIDGAGFLDCR
jgi:hypothetical protein